MRTVLPSDYRDALLAMHDKLVNVEIQDPSLGLPRLLINATPFLVLLGTWIFLVIGKFPRHCRPGAPG